MTNYFPTHLAMGKAFCNRQNELARLMHNIENVNPTLIISPRRYGKTSLVLNAFSKIKIPYTHIDFYKELSEADIEKAILNGIADLLGKMEKTPQKLLKLIREFFSDMQVKIVLEDVGVSVSINRQEKKQADNIHKALEKLHALAQSRKTKLIFYMDEFQILGEICSNYSIEAAIRESAQKSSHVAYIFSGSSRHLMEEMFYDKKRPFYKLCDTIHLNRISVENYIPHLQKAAMEKWQKSLDEKTIECLFKLTERHPYYINKICSTLWLSNYPTEADVMNVWLAYTLENRSVTERELELLTINQRKLLIIIANDQLSKEPYEKDFSSLIQMQPSSTRRALKTLQLKDYIFIDSEKRYRVVDPLIKSVLRLRDGVLV
ncbi:MAG: ATP-binding protein [Gammaproteobacteria bacterium]|nr:ATP-binding protein [Gammaproteobacteria bacterium]